MGLDIIHYKICRKIENEFIPELNITTKSDIQRFDVGIEYFNDYWKEIFRFSCGHNYKVAYDIESYKILKKMWAEWNPNIAVIYCNVNHKQELIDELSSLKENKNLHLFIKNELNNDSFNFYHASKIMGFYSKQVGYQRKGVKDEFFEKYDINKSGVSNFVKKKDFEKVFELIGKYYDHETDNDVEQLRELYKRDFLEKYEEGISILTLSY
ncbi:MAG: hypothetical protein RLZZ546_513 [Bacteroidota bacterium]|jgi:hypothetical protein